MDKRFVDAEELLVDSYRLAVRIHEGGFRPDFIVGLWRGGSPVGIAVQECLEYLGVATDHISVRTSYRGLPSYRALATGEAEIRVHGLQYLLENLEADHALLIVDDVFASGRSTDAVIARLAERSRRNMPAEVRVAAPYYRRAASGGARAPDFWVHETDDWLVLPYELVGLTGEEIRDHKPGRAAGIVERLEAAGLRGGGRSDGAGGEPT